jgi:hypothetical protein
MTRRADLVDLVVRLRAAGRSWSEVKRSTGLSVADAKEMAQEPAQARRDALAHTSANEDARGLRDTCYGFDREKFTSCRHERQRHDEAGVCAECGCAEFTDKKPGIPVYERHPGDVGTQLRRLTGVLMTRSPWNGKPLSVGYYAFEGSGSWPRRQQADDPRIPSAKRATRLRRAKKKAARG